MGLIRSIAHPNEMTDRPDDFYLTPEVTGTLTLKGVIERLRQREIATMNVNGESFVQTFLDECAAAASEGYNITTSFFQSSVGLNGVVLKSDLGSTLPASRVKVSVNLTQGTGAKKAVESTEIFIHEEVRAAGPVIQSVSSPESDGFDRIPLRGMVRLEGRRFAVRGDAEGLGVIFEKEDDSTVQVVIPAKSLSPNTATQIQFGLPATVTAGNWRVMVKTQASSSSSLVKTPRTGTYANLVTVYDPAGGEGGGGDDVLG